MKRLIVICAAFAALRPAAALAQLQAPDTIQLLDLQLAATVERDPRFAELDLNRRITALRQRSIDAELRPALSIEGQAQYQSDVTRVPIRLPDGRAAVTPPHDTYDARMSLRQTLFDPSIGPRRAVENSLLAQSNAELLARLYLVRGQVDELFFGALELQSREAELASIGRTLESQLALVRARVRNGAALPGDSATLAAELLSRQRDLDDLVEERRATLAILSDLTGRAIDLGDVLALPSEVDAALEGGSRAMRPEVGVFQLRRETLTNQESVLRAELLPRLSAFARAGYGRPGLNVLSENFDQYWLGGIQFSWTPWNWGMTGRRREELTIQRQTLVAEQEALQRTFDREAVRERAAIARLERAIEADARLIQLRDIAAREGRLRYGEGVITAAEYVARQNEALEARLAGAAHRVELARAQVRLLNTTGIGLPSPTPR